MNEILDRIKRELGMRMSDEGIWLLDNNIYKLEDLDEVINDNFPETYDSREDRHDMALILLAMADELLTDENYEDGESEN